MLNCDSQGKQKASVLIIDHCLIIGGCLCDALMKRGLHCLHVESVEDAHHILDGSCFDVILFEYKEADAVGGARIESLVVRERGSVVMFSEYAPLSFVKRAVDFGVRGFIPKSSSFEEFFIVLHLIISGVIYLPSSFYFPREGTDPIFDDGISYNLTLREREIAELVCDGLSNKEISASLGVTQSAVSSSIRSIRGKLGLRNRAHLIALGLRHRP